MLTKQQRRRLAKEARLLAMECVEGTAPEFGYYDFWRRGPVCALGHFVSRCGADNEHAALDLYDDLPPEERICVMRANDDSADRHAAVVFPLLALADALEGK